MQRKIFVLALILLVPAAFSLACGNKSGSNSVYNSNAGASVVLTGHIMNAVQSSSQGGCCQSGMSSQAGMSCPAGMACPTGCTKAGANVVFYNDADHQVYVIFVKNQSPLQHKMNNFVQKNVEITAVVHKDATTQGVEIQSIKELSAKGKS
jgi:hypothetical protein